jgi:hypothetical protein
VLVADGAPVAVPGLSGVLVEVADAEGVAVLPGGGDGVNVFGGVEVGVADSIGVDDGDAFGVAVHVGSGVGVRVTAGVLVLFANAANDACGSEPMLEKLPPMQTISLSALTQETLPSASGFQSSAMPVNASRHAILFLNSPPTLSKLPAT